VFCNFIGVKSNEDVTGKLKIVYRIEAS